jgi:transcriptional regulator with XRE-family HTH domain
MKERTNPTKNKIGLREIAAESNVSVATVSRVLNGNSRVDPAIRDVVLQAAAKMNVDVSKRNKTKPWLSCSVIAPCYMRFTPESCWERRRIVPQMARIWSFFRTTIPRLFRGRNFICRR